MDLQAVASVLVHARPAWLLAACLATAVSLLAAAGNLTAFTPRPLPAAEALRAQLAVCGLRVVAPAALSTPAICARYLVRSGLSLGQAAAVVGTAQTAQLAMTVAVLTALAALGLDGLPLPDPGRTGLCGALAVAVLALCWLVGARVPPLRRAVRAVGVGLRDIGRHAHREPLRITGGLVASAGLTLAHVAAFGCCVTAVGGHAPPLALAVVYLGAASAGSLVPTPGGLGAVEAAMIAGLVGAGLGASTATAAALLTRVITLWALAPPGWWALRSLRRRGLL